MSTDCKVVSLKIGLRKYRGNFSNNAILGNSK
jgi:hypothetical protein